MVYLRNLTKVEQWLVDPQTGIGRKVEAESLVRVTDALAVHAVQHEPQKWQRVEAIPLGHSGG